VCRFTLCTPPGDDGASGEKTAPRSLWHWPSDGLFSLCQATMPFTAAEKKAMELQAKGGGGSGPHIQQCCFPGWLKGCVLVRLFPSGGQVPALPCFR